MADSMTVLRNAGPPGTKRNIVVLGDGFQAGADQTTYNDWVDSTLIKGVFGHDYYSEDASAYNIYRINLESVDSGVSTRTYDEHGTPDDPSDDTIASEVAPTLVRQSGRTAFTAWAPLHRAADVRVHGSGAGR
jgi:hypothetical protein